MTPGGDVELISPRDCADTDRICKKGKTVVAECSGCGCVVTGRKLHYPFIVHGFYCVACCPCREFVATVEDKEAMKRAKRQALIETRRFVVIQVARPEPPSPEVKAKLEADRAAVKEAARARREEQVRAKEARRAERLQRKAERLTRRLTSREEKDKLVVERAERKAQRIERNARRTEARAERAQRVSYREADLLALDTTRYRIETPDFAHLDADAARIERNRFIKKRRLLEAGLSPEEKRRLKSLRMSAAKTQYDDARQQREEWARR